MATTIEQAHQFIADVKSKRANFEVIGERSWAEIKKFDKSGKLVDGKDLWDWKKKKRYPTWFISYSIRQPITLARLPLPILKDTQDQTANDPYGQTACIIGERFVNAILKTFDPLPVFQSGNKDFLVTDFGQCRPYYRQSLVSEEIRIPVQQMMPPQPQQDPNAPQDPNQPPQDPNMPPPEPIFITQDGQQVDPQNVKQDDVGGLYIATGEMHEVENEELYLSAVRWNELYVDPDAIHWTDVMELAFGHDYSYRAFIEKFGQPALEKFAQTDDYKSGQKKIKVYEYWNKWDKECKWFADESKDFFRPEGLEDDKDLYGLAGFFPCAEPLRVNNPTDDFWPIPLFYQIKDLIDHIHMLVSRVFTLAKAIRIRFLVDGSLPNIDELINETDDADGIKVPGLAGLLEKGRTLDQLVMYFPVETLMKGLQQAYASLQQGLDLYFQATGESDLIRGQSSNDTDKTLGERQMEGKYANNRFLPYQEAIQNWVKNNYQLLMEMGLKTFQDSTIDEYVCPETLEEGDRQRYVVAVELLKNNRKSRFRVDFETDATIAINQEYQRQEAIDSINAITKALESTANVAKESPAIAKAELVAVKNLITQFSEGKLFMDSIIKGLEEAIDEVGAQQGQQDPAAALEGQKLQIESEHNQTKLMLDDRFRNLELRTNANIKYAQMNQLEQLNSVKTQIELMNQRVLQGEKGEELRQSLIKLQADIGLQKEQIEVQREAVMIKLQELSDKKEIASLQLMFDERMAQYDNQISAAQLQLDATQAAMDAREKAIIDQRMQDGHALKAIELAISHHHETQNRVLDTIAAARDVTPATTAPTTPSEPAPQPHIDVHVQMPERKPRKRVIEPHPKKKGAFLVSEE